MAKFCCECGKELEENSNTCKNCGNVLEEKKNVNTGQVKNKTNGFAIAGFVISIVSIFCCGIPSWLGLVFSIIGLVNANKSEGEGKGVAIAGIVISTILLILLISLYALGFVAAFTETVYGGYYY